MQLLYDGTLSSWNSLETIKLIQQERRCTDYALQLKFSLYLKKINEFFEEYENRLHVCMTDYQSTVKWRI